jgi:protocatechuate 3,4-dioxygenase, beta subunit
MKMASRRRLLIATGGLLTSVPLGALADTLTLTPAQTEGPFYPRELPLDRDNDLATVVGVPQGAKGTITHVYGTVRDAQGRAVPGARVEIWQCNAFGKYHDARDRRVMPIDPGFQGFGTTTADGEGRWRFRTIRPVAYPGRTPHIHFAILPPGGGRLVTQMYVDGEAGNARDGVYRAIRGDVERQSVTVALNPAAEIEAGALAGIFNIVLGRDTLAG